MKEILQHIVSWIVKFSFNFMQLPFWKGTPKKSKLFIGESFALKTLQKRATDAKWFFTLRKLQKRKKGSWGVITENFAHFWNDCFSPSFLSQLRIFEPWKKQEFFAMPKYRFCHGSFNVWRYGSIKCVSKYKAHHYSNMLSKTYQFTLFSSQHRGFKEG